MTRRKKIRARAAKKIRGRPQLAQLEESCGATSEAELLRQRNLPGCVAGLLGNMEKIGIGDEARQVSGAAAVDLLNEYHPLLCDAFGYPRA